MSKCPHCGAVKGDLDNEPKVSRLLYGEPVPKADTDKLKKSISDMNERLALRRIIEAQVARECRRRVVF